jgi:hypothetical protein
MPFYNPFEVKKILLKRLVGSGAAALAAFLGTDLPLTTLFRGMDGAIIAADTSSMNSTKWRPHV